MDGGDRRLVHPLRGDVQAAGAGRPLLGREVAAQLPEQVVALLFVAEHLGRLHQAGTDAVAQLAGGSVGEGHHEDFRRQQLAGEAVGAAVAEHQAQVQGGNGEGLAGTGAGFDQPAAVQWEAQRQRALVVRELAHALASSLSSRMSALSSGW